MGLFKKLRARYSRKKAQVASDTLSGSAYEVTTVPPLAAISAVVLPQAAARDVSHVGMQGYAPIVRVSVNRRYCEYCGERVLRSPMHVCWGNVEHHMHTLTEEDRQRILGQLATKPRKLTRAQLRKLYSADKLGFAEIEGEPYGLDEFEVGDRVTYWCLGNRHHNSPVTILGPIEKRPDGEWTYPVDFPALGPRSKRYTIAPKYLRKLS